MAFITADRVKDTSTTTGTGNITVSGSAPFGYRTFSMVLSVSDTFYYCVQGQSTSEWEVGLGTYVSSNQFARTTILASSASNSAVSFSSGTKNVFITLPANKTLQFDATGTPTAGGVLYGTGSMLAYTAVGTSGQFLQSTGSGAPTWAPIGSVGTSISNGTSNVNIASSNGAVTIAANGTTAMTVGTNRNIGIGGAAASDTIFKWLTITGPTTSGGGVVQLLNSDSSVGVNIFCNNLAGYVGTSTAHPLGFRVNNNEAARIDTSGNLLVGTTSPIGGQGKFVINVPSGWGQAIQVANTSTQGILTTNTSGTGSYNAMGFYNNGTTFSFCGGITVSGSSTSFNVSSDYRLKENITPLTAGLATIGALKPVNYDWICDKSQGEGFIAHELQAVIPLAVTGEKDAVNENGSIKPQGVDYSKIVVHLVAAIQELSAKNDALEARLAALEAK